MENLFHNTRHVAMINKQIKLQAVVSIFMSECSSQFFNLSPNNLKWKIHICALCIYRWMVLPAGPLTAPVGQLQVLQSRTTVNPGTPPCYGGKDVPLPPPGAAPPHWLPQQGFWLFCRALPWKGPYRGSLVVDVV